MSVFRIVGMRQKHGIGVSLPHLFGTHINVLFIRVNIEEKLCRIQNFIDCLHRMLAPYNREKSNRIQDKKKRAGYPEKVTHHKVGCPGRLKFGKTVKNIKSILSLFFDYVMNVYRKGFEPVRQRHIYGLNFRTVLHKRFVGCKTKVYDISFVFLCLLYIRLHEKPELA